MQGFRLVDQYRRAVWRPVDVERGTERNAFWYLTGIRAEEDGADSKFSDGRQRDPFPIR